MSVRLKGLIFILPSIIFAFHLPNYFVKFNRYSITNSPLYEVSTKDKFQTEKFIEKRKFEADLYSVEGYHCSCKIFQPFSNLSTNIQQLKVPRSYEQSILVIEQNKEDDNEFELYQLDTLAIEDSIRWYLDAGGRINLLTVIVRYIGNEEKWPLSTLWNSLGFKEIELIINPLSRLSINPLKDKLNSIAFSCDPVQLLKYCQNRIASNNGQLHVLYNIVGRLQHFLNQPNEAIDSYTKALTLKPDSDAIFRNLGSAYHAVGNLQLALASYQQAIQLNPLDALVYLKLAFFYEDFAMKDWVEADTNAEKCYRHYLDQVDPEDTSVLTRLGNLLLKQQIDSKVLESIEIFKRVLLIDGSLYNVWFNKAHAELKLKDFEAAKTSLQQVLSLNASIPAAKHMLRALIEEEAVQANQTADEYIIDLFNGYAASYDVQVKKLMYAAPRVIRQELAKVYKSRYGGNLPATRVIETSNDMRLDDEVVELVTTDGQMPRDGVDILTPTQPFTPASGTVGSSCQTYSSFMNHSLDILDLGCGTGQMGAWLKDYAKSLVGVDISEQMITVAKKKLLYQELNTLSIQDYFEVNDVEDRFDLVVATEVFAYVGDITQLFPKIIKALRSNGIFAFTVESCDISRLSESGDDPTASSPNGYRLLKSGRFGYRKQYIDELIRANNQSNPLNTLMSRPFSPRLEQDQAVPGYLYILERSS